MIRQKISGKARILFVAIKRYYFKILVQNHLDCIKVARDVLFLGSGGSVPQRFLLGLSLQVSSVILPLVSNNLNLKASSVCVSFLRLWGLGNRCITHFLGGSGQLCVCSSGSRSSGDSRWSPTGAQSSWLHQDSQGFFR